MIAVNPTMTAMAFYGPGRALVAENRPTPLPGPGEIRLRVEACGVCRTDLHLVDGELLNPLRPVVPGHEIVGRVDAIGSGVTGFTPGARVGVPWLGHACGSCPYCAESRENLCDDPRFTGYTRDGGYATHVVADAAFCFPLPDNGDPALLAPLLCAGLIGWRTLRMAGPAPTIGIYGFGAAAHIIAQVAIGEGRRVHAFVRPGDRAAADFARALGAVSAQDSTAEPPELLDAALIFAPVGALVPQALAAVRKGGAVVCGGIHMSDIPAFPYARLWGERRLLSIANLTRADAHEFLSLAPKLSLEMRTVRYPLAQANAALEDLRAGRLQGAAVLIP